MKQMDPVDTQLQMRGLLMGFVVSRASQVAAELGVAEALAGSPKEPRSHDSRRQRHPGSDEMISAS